MLVSDGGDNSSVHVADDVMRKVLESRATIYTIGIIDEDNPDRNPALLKRIAQVSGGEAYFPKRLSEVAGISVQIANDIRARYTIGYVPVHSSERGSLRKITVTAAAPNGHKLVVHTRTGLYAASRNGRLGYETTHRNCAGGASHCLPEASCLPSPWSAWGFMATTISAGRLYQTSESREFDRMLAVRAAGSAPAVVTLQRPAPSAVIGRLSVPRLHMSAMVREGVGPKTLKLADRSHSHDSASRAAGKYRSRRPSRHLFSRSEEM